MSSESFKRAGFLCSKIIWKLEIGLFYFSEQTIYTEKWPRKGRASVLCIKIRVREIGFNPGRFSIIYQQFEDERADRNFV